MDIATRMLLIGRIVEGDWNGLETMPNDLKFFLLKAGSMEESKGNLKEGVRTANHSATL